MVKPAYMAIKRHAAKKPALIYVPSRKQTKLTAIDLLAYAAADNAPNRFLHVPVEDLEPYMKHIQDDTLGETLRNGIGYLHEGSSKEEVDLVTQLFSKGIWFYRINCRVSGPCFASLLVVFYMIHMI